MIMDYKYRYLHELRELIRPLTQTVKDEIYYDLIKLEDWVLPDIDELRTYLTELDFDIDLTLWRFIYMELTFKHHCSIRNRRVIRMLKFIKKKKLKIRPFVITYAPFSPDWEGDEDYFLGGEMGIKSYRRRRYSYDEIYEKYETDSLLDFDMFQ